MAAEPRTTDYCEQCGESPDSASHGPFAGSHPYVMPSRDSRVITAREIAAGRIKGDNIGLAQWILALDVEHKQRLAELHEALAKLTRETPYPDELDECRRQRAALIAEVGTLRAALREACEIGRSEFHRLADRLSKRGDLQTTTRLARLDQLQALAGDGA